MDLREEWGLAQTPSFGAGTQYQAACPPFPPAPAGYVAWNTGVNGAVPAEVVAAATALANDMTKPLGFTQTVYSGGVPLLLRVDPHTWTLDAQGNASPGCYHGVDVWIPAPTTAPPATAAAQSTSNTLLVISIALGGVVSALSIIEYFRGRKP